MDDSATSVSPPPQDSRSRQRSRSIASNAHGHAPGPVNVAHYSPEQHPTTDPSLLALTQQQVSDASVPIDSALLEQSPAPASFPLDPALGTGPAEPAPRPRTASTPGIDAASFDHNSQHMDMDDDREAESAFGEDDVAGALSGRNSKRSSTAGPPLSVPEDNDAELRRLAQENATVDLNELAKRVRNDENTPAAEKTRQVYGLGWLMRNCERVPDTSVAVPRNRVYARYVGICANERIKPLNPASFGKLVRLMFPEIKTRRLGVRGQSKYHYCGIRLAGEHSSPKVSQGSGSASGSEPPAQAAGDDHVNGAASPFKISFQSTTAKSNRPSSRKSQHPPHVSALSLFMTTELCFPHNDPADLSTPHDILQLPDIEPYVPLGTDPDIAATLTAIYRSHCTSLVECVRYMRLKQFHQLFISFHGTLTAPVQKLLGEPSVAPWIRESDWVMYKEMIRLLSPLTLQVVPSFVLQALRQLSQNLVSHITTTFAIQPQQVIEAKLSAASVFASLLNRLLRVNDAAHAAARFLGNPPDREQMIKDWKAFVDPQTIVDREIPCVSPEVVNILVTDVIELLQPASSIRSPLSPKNGDGPSTESVLDMWTQFLSNLPARFPRAGADPRYFNMCVGAVASAALRDLTTNGAISFGSWWVVRCWIDEWLGWLAERGGFLNHSAHSAMYRNGCGGSRGTPETNTAENGDELGHDDSGVSLRGEDAINLLDEVSEARGNRMVPVNFGK